MKDYSQSGEQKIILDYFGDRVGTFLSIGENDGETLSNTRALALNGWNGACVEPGPAAFKRLIHLYESRPDIHCIRVAITSVDGPVILYESGPHQSIADTGLVSSIIPTEKLKWEDTTSFKDVVVDGATFNTFMEDCPYKKFNFISIDAEAMDLTILEQMDLKKLGCEMLCVEWGLVRSLADAFEVIAEDANMELLFVSNQNLIFAL